jgi:DNA modification methylase
MKLIKGNMNPYWTNELGELYLGNSLDVLKNLDRESADLSITSPPYWRARKYVSEDELGQESHYNTYLTNLCNIFAELRPIIKESGSLFVVIGDKYFSRISGSGGPSNKQDSNKGSRFKVKKIPAIMPQGSLVNIPNRFAIKMVDDCGWILKHTIIWHKPNAMVTSNKRKFTPDFEYVYHFVKNTKKYYFKQQFEPLKNPKAKSKNATNKFDKYGNPTYSGFEYDAKDHPKGRNKRSVWSISTRGFRGNHYATYPADLICVPIKACCPEDGIIIDPFFGAGTTALEAENQNKKWIGIEISKEYCDMAIKRIKENG